MDKQRFSRVNYRVWAALAISAAFFVPLGVFGAPALAKSASAASEYKHSGSSQYQYKITICHRTHSKKHPFVQITVNAHAGKAHLGRRDTLGPCPPVTPPVQPKHGRDDGDRGKGNDNSGGDDHGQGGEHGRGNSGNGGNDGNGNDHGNGGGNGHHK